MFKSLRARKNSVWNIFFYLFLQEPALSKVEGQTVLREIPTKVRAWDIILSEVGNSDFSKKKLGSRTHLAFIFLVSLLLKSWLQKRTAKQDACVRDNIISRSTRLPSNIVARGWSWFRDLEIEKAILVWRLRKS